MDNERFDALVASLADAGASRRMILGRLAGGSFAVALAGLGIGGIGLEEAEAKKKCRRCRKKKGKKKRRCLKRCRKGGSNPPPSFDIDFNITNLNQPCVTNADCSTGLECVTLLCVPSDLGDECEDGGDCSTGFCSDAGLCALCVGAPLCGEADDAVCCVVGAECVDPVNGVCVFPE